MRIGFRLFNREFIGSIWKTLLFILLIMLLLSVVGVLWVGQNSDKMKEKMADVTITGAEQLGVSSKLYDSLSDVLEVSQEFDSNQLTFVPSVSRFIASVEDIYTGNEVLYTIKGYEEGELNNRFVYFEGRAPKLNSNEVAIGYYIAQTLGLTVGCTIGGEVVSLANNLQVKIYFSLEETPNLYSAEWPQVTVVGIVDENISDVSNSIIMPYDKADNTISPNVIDVFFKDSSSVYEYRKFIDKCSENRVVIGGISEQYIIKENARNQRRMIAIEIMLYSVAFILLMMMYLCRGIGKKIGLLKSFGIPNSHIYLTFSGWLTVMVLIAYACSIVIVTIICSIRNSGLSDFYGFELHRFSYSMDVYLLQAGVGLVLIVLVWLYIIRFTRYVSPNVCMTK